MNARNPRANRLRRAIVAWLDVAGGAWAFSATLIWLWVFYMGSKNGAIWPVYLTLNSLGEGPFETIGLAVAFAWVMLKFVETVRERTEP